MQTQGKMTVILIFCKICYKCILFSRYFSVSQISSTCIYISEYNVLKAVAQLQIYVRQKFTLEYMGR